MSNFRDWFFEHVFRPRLQRWAERRTRELVSERAEIYDRLMDQLQHIERDIARTGERDGRR